MSEKSVKFGIVGCGNIAGPYARSLMNRPQLELAGATDLDRARAEALMSQYGGRVYPTLDDMLADPSVDLVVNLTVHRAHYAVTRQCLEAGKHVYSEKPLAMTREEAQELVALAQARERRLGGAPFTFLGEAQQTAWQVIRSGRLGPVRLVYAEVNWGRIETWHPAPQPFYEVGALFDVGVYPLAILTAFFGPARSVRAYGQVLHPERITTQGEPFHLESPDFMVTMIEFADNLLVRLTTNFYVSAKGKQGAGIEFHGDEASLYLSSWHNFNATVEIAPFNQPYTAVPLLREPYPGVEWARGLVDMADAMLEGRPHRASGEQAAHIVEILDAAMISRQSGQAVPIHSTFTPPAPLEWAV